MVVGHVDDLARAARLHGVEVSVLEFTRLSAAVAPPHSRASALEGVYCDGVDLRAFDAVIVRSMPRGSLEEVIFRMDALQRLQAAGVRVVNPPRALECAIDKYLSLARLAAAGLPVPETVACEDGLDPQEVFDALGGDVVMKPLFGSEGRGLHRFRDASELHEHTQRAREQGSIVYLQRYVPHEGFDYRLLVLDGEGAGRRASFQ